MCTYLVYLIQHWVCRPPSGPENPSWSVSTPCLIAPLPRPYRPGTLHCAVWPLVLVNTPASSSTLRGAPKYKVHCRAPTISTCSLKKREFQYFVIHSWPRASPPHPGKLWSLQEGGTSYRSRWEEGWRARKSPGFLGKGGMHLSALISLAGPQLHPGSHAC